MRTLGEVKTAKEFERIVINQRGGQPIYSRILLKQVAEIEDGLEDIRRISRANGERAVGIGIRKQRGSNTVAVAQGVKQRMAEVAKTLPEGMGIAVNFDTTKHIEDSVDEFKFALVMSALVTALVCWLFLGSWTATLNVILAIPTSIVGTFIVLYFFGFTLNTFTLLGLSLAIGIVVDDAIMVLENIVRHREKGENRVEAALKGSRQITFAAIAATLAVIAIFLPVAFMSGVIGKFFFQFGVTMTVAVSLSLLEALTLTPMRASQFVEAGSRNSRIGRAADIAFHAVAALYHKMLTVAVAHPLEGDRRLAGVFCAVHWHAQLHQQGIHAGAGPEHLHRAHADTDRFVDGVYRREDARGRGVHHRAPRGAALPGGGGRFR